MQDQLLAESEAAVPAEMVREFQVAGLIASGGSRTGSLHVMPGLVPGIHVFASPGKFKTWMAGTRPAMTT